MAEDIEKQTVESIKNLLERAENRVLFPEANAVKARICGEDVELQTLPIAFSETVGKVFQEVVDLASVDEKGSAEDRKRWEKENATIVANAFCDTLVEIAKAYDLEDIDRETIKTSMAMKDVKALVVAQVEMNAEDDFLLQPLRFIMAILSGGKEVQKQVQDAAKNLTNQTGDQDTETSTSDLGTSTDQDATNGELATTN
jgi:hypothetical protein